MQVGREETIAGVRLMKVRDFLRWTGDSSVQLDAIKERFGCDQARGEQIEKTLIDAGYLEDDPNETKPGKWYIVSALGRQLCNAKFVRRISRPEAETLVAGLLERVKLVNERDELTHRVTEVRVFGSYLSDKADLGDVDLAVQYTPRRLTHIEEAKQRAAQSGKSMSNFLQIITYGTQEIRQILKNRSPYLSLHEHGEPEQLGVAYRVLFTAARP
jgi:predicted nucleotidyltransferase